MKYVATDGTVFTDRSSYRKYEMETQYTFRNQTSTTLTKRPGQIAGQPFDIISCHKSTILLLDNCDQVQIDDVSDSKIFVGASSGSIFVRNCSNCIFTVASKQLRTRDCQNCTFNLYCKTEPCIETSTDMKFAPFNGAYQGHRKAMLKADLDPAINKWDAVYDFNDPSETRENWRIVRPSPLWCPLGEADPCIPSFGYNEQQAVPEHDIDSDKDDVCSYIGSLVDEERSTTPTSEEESGSFHKIKVCGYRAWSIVSSACYSVQAFCLGLIFGGILPQNLMISQR